MKSNNRTICSIQYKRILYRTIGNQYIIESLSKDNYIYIAYTGCSESIYSLHYF